MTIAVTGATGALGGQVAQHLADAGISLRLLVRDPGRAPALANASVEVCEYGDADAVATALRDVDTVFMVSATATPERLRAHRTFVTGAVAAGVQHIVYTSFVGADPDATFTFARDHAATEQLITESGMRYTYLRNNLFHDVVPSFVDADDVLRGPGGSGRASFVARDDVACAAAQVLQHPGDHANAAYTLTGRESLTLAQVAAVIADATGRPVTYREQTPEQARKSRLARDLPPWQLDAWLSSCAAIEAGELEAVSGDVARLTGREPISFAETVGRQQAGQRDRLR